MYGFEPKFDQYLNGILSSLKIDRKEKRQLKQEWNQHLLDILDNLLQSGLEREKSIDIAIQQFGSPELLKQEVTEVYASTKKQHRLKESAIWIICLIAAAIGPYILIKAQFSFGFILTTVLALLFYYVVYHKIIKVIPNLISYFALLPIYIFWVFVFLTLGNEVSAEQYITNLFTLDWSRLTGVDGIFQFPTLHMLWYITVLVVILTYRHKAMIKQVVITSFRYWTMLTVGLALAKIAPNSETSVIVLNVALLYAFLQQIVSTIRFYGVNSNEKIYSYFNNHH